MYLSKQLLGFSCTNVPECTVMSSEDSVSALYTASCREYDAYLRGLPRVSVNFVDFQVDVKCSRELADFVRGREIKVTTLQDGNETIDNLGKNVMNGPDAQFILLVLYDADTA